MITPIDAPSHEPIRVDDPAQHSDRPAAFDPLVSIAVDVHTRQQTARDIATANRHAGLDRQLLDADLRVLDAEIRSREDLRAVDVSLAELGLGPAAGLFKTAAPHAAQLADQAAPAHVVNDEASESAVRHEPRAEGQLRTSGPRSERPHPAEPPAASNGTVARDSATGLTPPPQPTTAGGRMALPAGLTAVTPQAVGTGPGGMMQGQGRGTAGGHQHGQIAGGESAHTTRARRGRPAFSIERGTLPQAAQRKTIDHVMKILQSRHTPGRSTVKLRLTPPELGTLTVDIKLQGDAMSLRFETHSAAVRDLLHDHAAELTEALREQGLRMDGFEVEITREPDEHTGSAAGDGRSQHTDSSMSHGQDADARGESTDADDPETALIEAAEQGVMAAGRVDIRA